MAKKATSRRQIRRQIRKANRIASVDPGRSHRICLRVILILGSILFLVGESVLLVYSKRNYEHVISVELAESMIVDLSLIDTALRTGDRAVYDKAYASFHDNLAQFVDNEDVKKHSVDLAQRLAAYHNELLNNQELAEIINLRTATMKISTSANLVENEAIDIKDLNQTKKDFEALLVTLEQIETPELADLKDNAIVMTKEYINYLNNAAVCVGVCSSGTITEKQKQLQTITEKYLSNLEVADAEYSKPYNPNLLIIELSKYSKI